MEKMKQKEEIHICGLGICVISITQSKESNFFPHVAFYLNGDIFVFNWCIMSLLM